MFEEDSEIYEDLNHLIGVKHEKISMVEDYSEGFEKDARRRFNKLEQRDLIEENWGGTAANFAKKGDISKTHYEKHNKAEIAMMMPKGL